MVQINYGESGAIAGGAAKGLGESISKEQQKQFQQDHLMMKHQLNLEAETRARAWEIEKMEVRSRLDFERKERERQMELDSIDNKLKALEKEQTDGRVDGTNITYQNLITALKNKRIEIETGVELPALKSEYGVAPWFMSPQYQGTSEAMAARERAGQVERVGNIPWYLSPENIDTPAGIAAQENQGIFLTADERAARMAQATGEIDISDLVPTGELTEDIARQINDLWPQPMVIMLFPLQLVCWKP